MELSNLILICLGGVSAVLTFVLQTKFALGTVRASSLVGLMSVALVFLFPNVFTASYTTNFPLVCFGASFIGMTTVKVLNNYYLLALAGAMFSCLFLLGSSYFEYFGGALGTTACIALLLTLAINKLSKHLKA